ncbi:MAG: LUD domain-containing protein [Desulfobaccales bacterium]
MNPASNPPNSPAGLLKPLNHSEPGGASETVSGTPPAAVRAACHRALMARERILQGYPDWQAWRRQARDIKAEAISRLDELLQQMARGVQAWGGKVLWARDAAQARELILGLTREHRVTMVTKSKSMTTEEICLNPALSAAGIRTLETDLGEFIVQLAGDSPAHLTAPALHLDRRQIATIFRERLGTACPQDPAALTRLACDHIQPDFWRAGMGITGVNFAAPDGTLVFLENESNLRLTATLPPVQVALMGLEKIIPALADVEVLLRLLPASATGQRLTALVHFLRGRKFQPEGPQAFYLIILDNGRRRLARDPEFREALYCLRCGACLNVCPIFQLRAAHLYRRVYPGAIGILLAPHLAPVGDISDLCSQCGACQEICPVGIRLTENILKERARSRQWRNLRTLSGLAGQALVRPRLYRSLEPGLRLLQTLAPGRQQPPWPALRLSPESFQRRWRRQPHPGSPTRAPEPPVAPAGVSFSRATEAVRFAGPGGKGDAIEDAPSLAARLEEVGATCRQVRGADQLARLLAQLPEPLWFQDHPWLSRAARELRRLGLSPHLVKRRWAPPGQTAVSVGLGAIPETGSVLIEAASGPAAAISFRVPRLVVIVPREAAALSLAQALDLVARQAPGMITWLTGPSRTADIEKVLVLGAQGPRELQVVIYQQED